MSDAPNACPDCGSVNRTMIQDASNDDIVWSCENGHTWRDVQKPGAAKPDRASGRAAKQKETPEKDTKR